MKRGFDTAEFDTRLCRAQGMMGEQDIAALLLTTEPDVRYFTGFLTRFWESPTRPWFLVVPQSGKPIAVIPSIGAPLMARCGVADIRTWRAPDMNDDGVSLLADTLQEVAQRGKIATPSGLETHVRMPLSDLRRLEARVGDLTPDTGLMHAMRAIKSEAEIAKIAHACGIADRTFAQVAHFAKPGTPLDVVFREFQRSALAEGGDWVPYVAGGAGPDGYADVISPATSTPLAWGDALMLDTGILWDGYFCDFDRNFAVGQASQSVQDAHRKLIEAVHAAKDRAKPGVTAADLFHTMDKVCTDGAGGSDAGRLGHGLGMQLTEGLSLIPDDHTVLQPGMVLTLEPGIETQNGCMLVHEENIVIRENGAAFLSTPSGAEIMVI